MSVINGMLNDLQARASMPEPLEGYTAGRVVESSSVWFDSKKRWLLISLLSMAVVYLLASQLKTLWFPPNQPDKPLVDVGQFVSGQNIPATVSTVVPVTDLVAEEAGASVAPVALTTQAEPVASQLVSGSTVNIAEAAVSPTVIESAPVIADEDTVWLADQLQQAELAVRRERLTSPVFDNAFSYYRAVLQRYPNNAAALSGIETIGQRYLTILATFDPDQQPRKVQKYSELARYVGVTDQQIAAVLNAGGVSSSVTENSSVITENSAAVTAPALPSTAQVQVKASWRGQEKQLLASLQNQPLSEQQEQQLWQFTAQYPQASASREFLLEGLLNQNRLADARQIIAQSTALPRASRDWLQARWLLASGQAADVITLYKSAPYNIGESPENLMLWAAAYQQQQQFAEAVPVYQQLLRIDTANAAYWLGLATSLDAVSDSAAGTAYQRVMQLSPESAPYMNYVRQRLAALKVK